jgi:hypothetical protein
VCTQKGWRGWLRRCAAWLGRGISYGLQRGIYRLGGHEYSIALYIIFWLGGLIRTISNQEFLQCVFHHRSTFAASRLVLAVACVLSELRFAGNPAYSLTF